MPGWPYSLPTSGSMPTIAPFPQSFVNTAGVQSPHCGIESRTNDWGSTIAREDGLLRLSILAVAL